MNIFFLFLNPALAANALCDVHVVKMATETAQILCMVWRHLHGQRPKTKMYSDHFITSDKAEDAADKLNLYKMTRAHYNHPAVVWARSSYGNFCWTIAHGFALCKEYYLRYGKSKNREHACKRIMTFMDERKESIKDLFDTVELTVPPQCVKEEYKIKEDEDLFKTTILAYRNYYIGEKNRFTTYKFTSPPQFIIKDVKKCKKCKYFYGIQNTHKCA